MDVDFVIMDDKFSSNWELPEEMRERPLLYVTLIVVINIIIILLALVVIPRCIKRCRDWRERRGDNTQQVDDRPM